MRCKSQLNLALIAEITMFALRGCQEFGSERTSPSSYKAMMTAHTIFVTQF